MSEKPKRLWFRFHLLTLVLTALAFGALLDVPRNTPTIVSCTARAMASRLRMVFLRRPWAFLQSTE